MKFFNVLGWLCGLSLLVGSVQAEYAWIRFDPERPGYAATPAFAEGWQVIDQFDFAAPEDGEEVAVLGFLGPVGPAAPALLQDVMDETVFDFVEVVLQTDAGQTRLLLERVRLAGQTIYADANSNGPREERLLAFEAITYIYEPEAEDVVGAYSEVDIATGSGGDGDYTPRDPDTDPIFGATLARDPALPGQFSLSWESEPGIQYDIEFSDDLTDPDSWAPISSGQVFGEEGRRSTLTVTEPRGFYRIRER